MQKCTLDNVFNRALQMYAIYKAMTLGETLPDDVKEEMRQELKLTMEKAFDLVKN